MDPVVQLDPERCICVLGPQLAVQYLEQGTRATPRLLSYKGLVEAGVRRVLEAESFANSEEKVRREMLLSNVYELEPAFAAFKIVESLKTHRCYEQWVSEVFSSLRSIPSVRGSNACVDHLLALQEKGVLLAYTHYDTVLDTALNTSPVLLENEEAVRNWAARRTSGLLHIHGVHSIPATMKWDCVSYGSTVGDCAGGKVLKELCKTRNVIFIGFDGDHFDPFLPKFVSTFCSLSQVPSKCPLMLTSTPTPATTSAFLSLKLPPGTGPDQVLYPGSTTKPGKAPKPPVWPWGWEVSKCTCSSQKLILINVRTPSHLKASSTGVSQCLVGLPQMIGID